MNPVRRVLIDLDDVCNLCTMHALKFMGCPVESHEYDKFPVECGYDIVAAANKLVGEERFTVKTFWNGIPREFWATIPISEEFHWLLGVTEHFAGRENICLLTAPTIDPDCLAGKLEWIHAHMPRWMHRQFLVGPRKHFCATPDALLIDDSDNNVNKFRDWGGQALLVPRPWNSLHAVETKEYLSEQLNGLIEDQAEFARSSFYALHL
jgi:hypothetical protein